MATGPAKRGEAPKGGMVVSIDTLNLLACEGDEWAAKQYDYCVYKCNVMLMGVRVKDGEALSYVLAE